MVLIRNAWDVWRKIWWLYDIDGSVHAPDVFKAGAALRPVTDWANYNHGYTVAILNEPFMIALLIREVRL